MCADYITRDAFEPSIVAVETARLVLRDPRMTDASEIARLANDLDVVKMTSRMPWPYRLEDANAWINAQAQRNRTGHSLGLTITRRDDGAVIGGAGYDRRADGAIAIGYWLGREHWGQGYATEAARAIVDTAFETLDINELVASVRVINDASRRVLAKAGFRYTDSGLDPAPARGGMQPVDRYCLTRRDWESLHTWRPARVAEREAVSVAL